MRYPGPDPASTDDLTPAIESLLPSLERFLRFEGPDPAAHRSAWYAVLDRPLPRTGAGPDAVLAEIRDVLIANGLRTGHPGFTGWVTTAPSTIAAAAAFAQSIASPMKYWATPGNLIDAVAIRWLVELLGFPATFGGTFTAGGSTANLLGIGAARQHAGERLGLDLSRDGIAGLRDPRVYASTETHHVVGRALGVLGMGRANLRSIPTNGSGRIDLDLLQAALDEDAAAGRAQVAVVGCAGDVNTGLVDPLPALARIAHDRGIWLHVDGAYGGFGLLDDRVRDLYGDVAAIDSFAVDPHKWLAAPVGTGAVIVRDENLLARAFAVDTGDYDRERDVVIAGDPGSPFDDIGHGTPDMGVDFSAPARGIAVWAILSEIGADGMRARVTRHLDCARLVAERARSSGELEVLSEPVLSICCFRYRPAGVTDEAALDALNERVVAEVRARGRTVTSSTRVRGRFAIRPCFINPRSGLEDADALVDEVLAVGQELSASS